MKVLVACEFSGVVREAFRALGHEAFSCDLLPSEGSHHMQCDVMEILDDGWDIIIAHPPCTFLCNSGVRHLHTEAGRWKKMEEGARFFSALYNAPAPYVAVENPIMHRYAKSAAGIDGATQIIQPWMFGHPEKKATCLWLKNLPKLVPTDNVKLEMSLLPVNEQNRIHHMAPSADRGMLRSITYQGIADAMAAQWGAL